IPEHKKRAFEYFGLKEKEITKGRVGNKVGIPITIIELEQPKVLEELGEPPE
ncbi:hypothetical protein KI387_036564, partial [Taxus chinensis]